MSDLTRLRFVLEIDEDGYPPVGVETLWCARLTGTTNFVVDNIPFFVRVATVGDTVAAEAIEGEWQFRSLVHASGNSLMRLLFHDVARRKPVQEALGEVGCDSEWLDAYRLLAVNVPETSDLSVVRRLVEIERAAGSLGCEEPLTRQGLQ